ncbi:MULTISPECIES: FkbM family methyltransferase [unclassified Streptomyces]|uniref:FkbM family methyltransferase n=1 Tax=unclassified Streptomyces TaxID=2593676 RepID=UPI0037F3006D
MTKPDRSPAPDAPKTELDEVRDLILRYPGVARAQLERTAGGRLTARVQGWDHANDLSPTGPLSELAEINPHETRFLYDEIFSAESYLQGGITLREDAVVFDVGANIGMFSLFVGARCPSADVFAFEPVPDVFDVLRSNVERHGVAARLLPFGLSDRDQDIVFNFYPGISIMSCRSDYADLDNEVDLIKQYVANTRETGATGRDDHLAQVEALVAKDFELTERHCRLRSLSEVIEETAVARIDLLKIDVQRAELDVLRGVEERHWSLIQQISMEVHDEKGTPTEGRVQLVKDLLTANGFRATVAEEDLLRGTGRYAVQAVRPEYADDPRPVVASAESGKPRLDPLAIAGWLAERRPAGRLPDEVVLVDSLPPRD